MVHKYWMVSHFLVNRNFVFDLSRFDLLTYSLNRLSHGSMFIDNLFYHRMRAFYALCTIGAKVGKTSSINVDKWRL